MQISLSEEQYHFVSTESQFPALCGGFGSGKTSAGIYRALAKKLQYPKNNVAYYLPTYDLVRNIGYPRFSEILEEQIRVPYKINRSEAYIDVASFGQIIFRTMDTPERIIGYEVGDSVVDELDTLQQDKAREVWNKIIGRNRQKKLDRKLNTVGVVTTPEGYRFVYDRWVKNQAKGYELIKAKTESNAQNLPDGYIDSLRNSYPSNLLSAYLDGEFVNLTAGSVYPNFDRALNATFETIQPNEPLHIGLDFNVTKMSAVIHVLRNDEPHAVMEFTGVFDTPSMIRILSDRFINHKLYIYPDASGNARKSNNASESDLSLLRKANFTVMVNSTNPAVKDRVLSVNAMLDKRRYKVNPDACPSLVESFERQAYDKNGEPDKTSGFDHVIDAAGYMISYRYPIAERTLQRVQISGI
jgi:phage terminase large subunit